MAPILERHLAAAGAPADLPVIICGMAGARQGWIEAPYVTLPAGLDGILAGAVPIPGPSRERSASCPAWRSAAPTRLTSCAARKPSSPAYCRCLPPAGISSACPAPIRNGSTPTDGVISGFQTWLTGELFSVLSKQSILRHSLGESAAPALPENPIFLAACGKALQQGGDIGPALFRIRAATLLHDLKPDEAAATLSGLLIGSEIASARRVFDVAADKVILVASGPLGSLYTAALKLAGCAVLQADADEAVRAGLFEAAKRLGWTGSSPESAQP